MEIIIAAVAFVLGFGAGIVFTLLVHEPPIKNRSADVDDLVIAKYRCRKCLRPLYIDIMPGQPGALYQYKGEPYCLDHFPRSGK